MQYRTAPYASHMFRDLIPLLEQDYHMPKSILSIADILRWLHAKKIAAYIRIFLVKVTHDIC